MFSRYFLAVCGVALVAAVANVADAIVSNDAVGEVRLLDQAALSESVEARNPGLIIAVRVLRAAFKWAAKHCLEQAARNCKQHWKHPKSLVRCARGFLHKNKGRCVAG